MSEFEALGGGGSRYTDEYTFIRGDYFIGKERLPYFSVAMSIEDAVRRLDLAGNVVFSPNKPVRLEELFQRDLDKDRAVTEIKTYLKQPNRVKFFNAFTVVLLPVEAGDSPTPLDRYPEIDDGGTGFGSPFQTLDVGTVKIGVLSNDSSVGKIKWNYDRVKAVIIDGQHRFYALKSLYDEDPFRPELKPQTTKIPVLLLVLDPRVKFNAGTQDTPPVLQLCRSIFIDLNKHARVVTRARQYLLDDKDLVAVAMRSILSSEIGVDAEAGGSKVPLATRVKVDQMLPLALVDWHSEQAKFDTSLYLSTTVALYDIVDMAINIPSPVPTNYDDIAKYIARLESRLDLAAVDSLWNHARIESRLAAARIDQTPFDLTGDEIRAAAASFRRTLGQLICVALTEIAPYRQVIDRYEQAGLVGGSLELWLGFDRSGKEVYEDRTGEKPLGPAKQLIDGVRDEFPLAFQVVFQKGFLQSLVSMDNARAALSEDWGISTDTTGRDGFARAWTERFNLRVSANLDFGRWSGPGIKPDGTIDYTQAAPRAIGSFTSCCLLAPFDTWLESTASVKDAATWLGQFDSETQEWLTSYLEDLKPGDSEKGAPGGGVGLLKLRGESLLWLDEVWAGIRRGKVADPLQALHRETGTAWRDYLKRYVVTRARFLDQPTPTSDEAFDLALVEGAKALASVALSAGKVG